VTLRAFTPHTLTSKAKLRAEIERAAREGHSIVDQELEIGLGSISVPIRSADGRVLAALNVCCPSSRTDLDGMRTKILPELLQASQAITRGL
jgi:IclR family pca regulon transcriptional regulator